MIFSGFGRRFASEVGSRFAPYRLFPDAFTPMPDELPPGANGAMASVGSDASPFPTPEPRPPAMRNAMRVGPRLPASGGGSA